MSIFGRCARKRTVRFGAIAMVLFVFHDLAVSAGLRHHPNMMTDPSLQASGHSGSGMDRKVSRPRQRWWRDRRIAVAIALVLAAALLWWLLPASGSTDVDAADLQTGSVERATFDDYVPVRATVAPGLTTLVAAMSGGQVQKLLVQDGAHVTVDQPLAQLANPELRLNVLTQ